MVSRVDWPAGRRRAEKVSIDRIIRACDFTIAVGLFAQKVILGLGCIFFICGAVYSAFVGNFLDAIVAWCLGCACWLLGKWVTSVFCRHIEDVTLVALPLSILCLPFEQR